MSHPAHYVTVTAPDGEVIGYAWGDASDVGWITRPASSVSAYKAGVEWYCRVRGAHESGLTPAEVLALISREPDVGPVTRAHDVAAIEELARIVTAADDRRLIAQLKGAGEAVWRNLAEAFDVLTDEDRKVGSGGGQKLREGVYQVSFPVYSKPLLRAVHALNSVGAVTPEHRWMDNQYPVFRRGDRLHPADAVRAATAIVRGERFCEGTITAAVNAGLLDAVADSLRAWYAASHAPQD
jgi:hypothetical protein